MKQFLSNQNMDLSTLLILALIGIIAGMFSGFIGIGGGIIIVPALVYFLGFSQHAAQGTSLAMMLPPVGFLGVMQYYKTGNLNIGYAVAIAIFFTIGSYYGSKLSLALDPSKVKKVFGFLMIIVALRMILSK